jgi:hypothetical protein
MSRDPFTAKILSLPQRPRPTQTLVYAVFERAAVRDRVAGWPEVRET